jgi:hypothetical protein
MSKLLSYDGTKLTLSLHPGQTRAWESKKRFVFIIAGTQSGKTSYMPIHLDKMIREAGEGDYLAVTSTYDLLKLKFLPELQNYFVHLFKWEYSASEKTIFRQYKPRMFTRIICRSADAEGGLESASAKGALFDECGQDSVKVNAWEAIQRRLSLAQGRVLAGTTPYNMGWLKTQIYDKWRGGDPDIEVIQFKSTMNPSFPVEEYERARRTLPTWKFQMFYNGEFSRPAGMIYEDFGNEYIVPAFDIPAHWARYMGVDFGAVHTCNVWVAQDPESGIYYQYRERLKGNMTTAQHVSDIRQYNEYNLRAWGGAKSETQQRMDWSAAGLHIAEPPIWDVESGINRVTALLKERKYYIFDTQTGTIDQFGTYARVLDANGQPTEKIKDKETYHYLDALRYVVCGITDAPGWLEWAKRKNENERH